MDPTDTGNHDIPIVLRRVVQVTDSIEFGCEWDGRQRHFTFAFVAFTDGAGQ
jgi:hypothetical protein